ncbi:glycosyltransferase family 4 protein [Priestia flexa]|uniref:glycosyltransferase family 4 protein n=1 Tax=Priestia flexa TaxID=86664 RepID=UPI0009C1CBBA|nr:glycosyltransferase family 1 protein [Priestia flexa]AQX55564.1 hypothetical protein BC359_15470 [Priestia flexa]
MKVAIDCRKLSKNKTGIGNYLDNIIKELVKKDNSNTYYLLFDEDIEYNIMDSRFKKVILNSGEKLFKSKQLYRIFWINIIVHKYLRKNSIDCFWGPDFVKPIAFSSSKSIITVHDLAFLKKECKHSFSHALYMRLNLLLNMRKGLKVNTVSKFSKADILENYRIKPQNIDITYCSFPQALSLNNRSNVSNEFNEINKNIKEREYLLFVGTLENRKNLKTLLYALRIVSDYKHNICLVVVGKAGNSNCEITNIIKELEIENSVYFTGFVSDDTLKLLYEKASVFVFPSLFEGFGIPLLEAMAAKTPIVASNTSSIPEVCGDAAILIPPLNDQLLAESILRILNDNSLRNELVLKGEAQMKKFEWSESAKVIDIMMNKVANM